MNDIRPLNSICHWHIDYIRSAQGKNIFLSRKRIHSLQRYGMRRRRLEFSDAFAAVLKRNREAKQMSKQALAQKAGLHQTYFCVEKCLPYSGRTPLFTTPLYYPAIHFPSI
jgi:hypothetical protein